MSDSVTQLDSRVEQHVSEMKRSLLTLESKLQLETAKFSRIARDPEDNSSNRQEQQSMEESNPINSNFNENSQITQETESLIENDLNNNTNASTLAAELKSMAPPTTVTQQQDDELQTKPEKQEKITPRTPLPQQKKLNDKKPSTTANGNNNNTKQSVEIPTIDLDKLKKPSITPRKKGASVPKDEIDKILDEEFAKIDVSELRRVPFLKVKKGNYMLNDRSINITLVGNKLFVKGFKFFFCFFLHFYSQY